MSTFKRVLSVFMPDRTARAPGSETASPSTPAPEPPPRKKSTATTTTPGREGKFYTLPGDTIREILREHSGGRTLATLALDAGLGSRTVYKLAERGRMPSPKMADALERVGVPRTAWTDAWTRLYGGGVPASATTPSKPSREHPTEIDDDEENDEVEHLRGLADSKASTVRALERKVRLLRARLADRRELAQEVAGAFKALPVVTGGSTTARGVSSTGTLVVALADWHIGEVVNADEMGGINAYDWKIASEGILDIARRIIEWAETQRAGATIDAVQILCIGDIISGSIHEELAAHAEFPGPVATARAGELLAAVIHLFAERFASVRALCIAGNHDRLARRTPAKKTNEDSLAYLAYTIARERLRGVEHVVVETPVDPMPRFDVHGRPVAALHGHQIKAGGISPYYGIARRSNSMARERTEIGGAPPSNIFIAHFHHFALLEDTNVVLCPSLIGATEWSRQAGFRGTPGQLACIMGKRGLHGFTVFERRTGRASGT